MDKKAKKLKELDFDYDVKIESIKDYLIKRMSQADGIAFALYSNSTNYIK